MAQEKLKKIGSIQKFIIDEMSFDVEILDTRKRQLQQYLIKPVSGEGKGWFSSFDRSTKGIRKINKQTNA